MNIEYFALFCLVDTKYSICALYLVAKLSQSLIRTINLAFLSQTWIYKTTCTQYSSYSYHENISMSNIDQQIQCTCYSILPCDTSSMYLQNYTYTIYLIYYSYKHFYVHHGSTKLQVHIILRSIIPISTIHMHTFICQTWINKTTCTLYSWNIIPILIIHMHTFLCTTCFYKDAQSTIPI